jgi:hypothetical protein
MQWRGCYQAILLSVAIHITQDAGTNTLISLMLLS